jgi:hypothetical protein
LLHLATNSVSTNKSTKEAVMATEHQPIQTPTFKQVLFSLLLFVLAMLVGNAMLLALESHLGLYSYLGHPQLRLLETPLQWLAEFAPDF